MNRKRLRTLMNALRRLERRMPEDLTFNMGRWHEKNSCGTSACALGYAATLPEFTKKGLTLQFSTIYPGSSFPVYRNAAAYSAAMEFFGISWAQAVGLFRPDDYDMPSTQIRPRHVANRIDYLLRSSRK